MFGREENLVGYSFDMERGFGPEQLHIKGMECGDWDFAIGLLLQNIKVIARSFM